MLIVARKKERARTLCKERKVLLFGSPLEETREREENSRELKAKVLVLVRSRARAEERARSPAHCSPLHPRQRRPAKKKKKKKKKKEKTRAREKRHGVKKNRASQHAGRRKFAPSLAAHISLQTASFPLSSVLFLPDSILLHSTMASVVTKALGLFDIQGAKANVRCV